MTDMRNWMAVALLMLTVTKAEAQVYLDPQAPVEERVKDAMSHMTTHEKIKMLHAQSKFTSAGVPRLGIRQLNMDDGPHGVREELEWNTWKPAKWTNDHVVAFPSLTCLAATWNRALSSLYGHAVSEEFAFRGKDIMLGPGVNIARTPLNGRAFEYMGEDPLLAGEMVVPYIKAVQANGVACCLKHFVLNDQETNRFSVNVNVSERAMREIYLPPFKKAVDEADVWTIMGSYNNWQGVHCVQNDALLNGILKGEWGFKGALISDWGGTTDTWQAATGGLDIEMGTYTDGKTSEAEFGYDDYYLADPFERLVEEGEIAMSVLDDKVSRVLRTIFLTSMNPRKVIGNQCSEAHYEACRQIAEEGIVLLKNQGAGSSGGLLPLTAEKLESLASHGDGGPRILVVGENATRSLTQGGGSSELKTLRDVSPLDGLRQCFGDGTDYAQGYCSGRAMYDHVDDIDPSVQEALKKEALEKAKSADIIIYIGGMNKNTRQDCENSDREGYGLSFGQDDLIARLADIQPNMVVVTFGGNAYAMPWIDKVPALVHCWYLGSESGTALANILTGKVNPSGKLPITFARRYEDYPYVKYGKEAYPGVTADPQGEDGWRGPQVYYREDVFVGYRGFEKDKIQPLFPFGYGLSYTTFRYGKPAIVKDAQGWTLTVNVTNTGHRAGKETMQLYIGDVKASVPRPVKELKGFEKVALDPGETKTVTMHIAEDDLAFWSETEHRFVAEPGRFKAYVGASSADIRGTVAFDL